MNYFPNGNEEKDLLRFIAKYQYLKTTNTKYFFTSKKYYRNRVNNLISKKLLRKVKTYFVLDELGIEYVQSFNFEYNKLNRNSKYLSRLYYISDLAAFYYNSNKVSFIPSFSLKGREMFTITARRFIGILEINGIEYLTYYISEEKGKMYLKSVIYDIQKEKQHRNIIVLVDSISQINVSDFAFGLNSVLVIEDNEQNREKLKYLNNVKWSEIIQDYYQNQVYLSEYSFCDYTDYKGKFVSLFYYLDTEKINRIKYFLRENKQKAVDIICNHEIAMQIKKELPTANYIIIDLDKYVDKELMVYD